MSSAFVKSQWFSQRIGREAALVRWGHFGQPVLFFPTAGGDAEEIDRMLMIRALTPLLEAGALKVYSCDSVAGQALMDRSLSSEQVMAMQDAFHQWIRHEVVPAIYTDCRTDDLPIWTAGASIGAFHAAACVCRFPDVFHRALSMSGSYDILRFIGQPQANDAFRKASPLHFLPYLSGPHHDLLRTRHIQLASGSGNYENIGESWKLAQALGARAVPNFVDDWGKDWHHDWVTWRKMAPKYFSQWLGRPES